MTMSHDLEVSEEDATSTVIKLSTSNFTLINLNLKHDGVFFVPPCINIFPKPKKYCELCNTWNSKSTETFKIVTLFELFDVVV